MFNGKPVLDVSSWAPAFVPFSSSLVSGSLKFAVWGLLASLAFMTLSSVLRDFVCRHNLPY